METKDSMSDDNEGRWTRAPASLRRDMGLEKEEELPVAQQEEPEGPQGAPTETPEQDDQTPTKTKLADIPAHQRPGVMSARSVNLAKRQQARIREEIRLEKLRKARRRRRRKQ